MGLSFYIRAALPQIEPVSPASEADVVTTTPPLSVWVTYVNVSQTIGLHKLRDAMTKIMYLDFYKLRIYVIKHTAHIA